MERDRFVFVCLHSALKVSACGLWATATGCKSALGADIYRWAPIIAVCKTEVNLPEDPETICEVFPLGASALAHLRNISDAECQLSHLH